AYGPSDCVQRRFGAGLSEASHDSCDQERDCNTEGNDYGNEFPNSTLPLLGLSFLRLLSRPLFLHLLLEFPKFFQRNRSATYDPDFRRGHLANRSLVGHSITHPLSSILPAVARCARGVQSSQLSPGLRHGRQGTTPASNLAHLVGKTEWVDRRTLSS